MKIRTCYFNLIEIVLTVAVITFGVVIILGMLPKGLNAARNTATLSYASEIMEQMGHYLQQSQSNSNNRAAYVPTMANRASDSVLDSSNIVDQYHRLIADSSPVGSSNTPSNTASDIPGDFQATGIHGVYRYTPNDGVYAIVIGNREIIDGEPETNIVFSGVLRVWSEEAHVRHIILNGHSDGSHAAGSECNCETGDKNDYTHSDGTRIRTVHMELSYPLSKEYAVRSKSYYSFDIQR